MRNNKRLALSAVALSILTVTSAASVAGQAKINKIKKSGMESAQSTTLSFADWRAQQMLEKQDFTDRLIVKFKNKHNGKAIPPGLAKKAGLSLKHEKSLKKNGFITCDSCYFFSKDENKFKEHLVKEEHLQGKKQQNKEANNEKDKINNIVYSLIKE